MKILVPIKQVSDPDQSAKLRLASGGRGLDTSGLDRILNPFDEYALEAALRLTENGQTPKNRLGEIAAVTVGDSDTEVILRSALALGASSAVRIDATDNTIDAHLVAKAIARLTQRLSADLVLLGRQTVDGDGNEVAQRVAASLDWPQVTCASTIVEHDDGALLVRREVAGGALRVRVVLPCVISVDLRIVLSDAVRSRHTPLDFAYPPGVRYASLPSILAAKRKPLEVLGLPDVVDEDAPVLAHTRHTLTSLQRTCQMVSSVQELAQNLGNATRGSSAGRSMQ